MDPDHEFNELRTNTLILLNARANSEGLSFNEKLLLNEQLRYCNYKLVKYACSTSWSDQQHATVKLFEMMYPELTFVVAPSNIRHKLCECVSASEKEENLRKVNELATLIKSHNNAVHIQNIDVPDRKKSDDCTHDVVLNQSSGQPTPMNVVIQQENQQNESLEENANTDTTDSTVTVEQHKEIERSHRDEDIPHGDHNNIIYETSVEIPVVNGIPCKTTSSHLSSERSPMYEDDCTVFASYELPNVDGGQYPRPKNNSVEFACLASKAFLNEYTDFGSDKCDAKKSSFTASIVERRGQSVVVIMTDTRIINKRCEDFENLGAFLIGLKKLIRTRQNLFEMICLYYWFRKKRWKDGASKDCWPENRIVSDDSLQGLALRALSLSNREIVYNML